MKTVTIEEKEYKINFEKAKELGLIEPVEPVKPPRKTITSIETGDVFIYPEYVGRCPALLIRAGYEANEWILAGCNGMDAYSNRPESGEPTWSTSEMVNRLNAYEATHVGNINGEIAQLIDKTVDAAKS